MSHQAQQQRYVVLLVRRQAWQIDKTLQFRQSPPLQFHGDGDEAASNTNQGYRC
jgi:hypothetical protein